MKGFAYLMVLSLLGFCCVSALNYKQLEKQMVPELEESKACYCILPNVLGGLCIQWSGGCSSGKREVEPVAQEDKCLCLTWNSHGVCIFCAGKRDVESQ
jgi:hypothetical protein